MVMLAISAGERGRPILNRNGLIIIDNTLWKGLVLLQVGLDYHAETLYMDCTYDICFNGYCLWQRVCRLYDR